MKSSKKLSSEKGMRVYCINSETVRRTKLKLTTQVKRAGVKVQLKKNRK